MDKRKAWREQEQRLIERWNAAAERYRVVQAELSSAGAQQSEELKLKAETARAEIEAVRRAVARLKVEFNSGKRY
jgi:hypothetical protein